MSRKIIYILIGLAVAGMVYHYIRKKKSAAQPGAPFIPASPANVAETARSLSLSEEDAVEVDDRRTCITEVNAVNANPDFKPVVTVAEQLTYNGKAFPVLGYEREKGRGQTMVMIPVEHTDEFTPFSGGILSGGILSRGISAKVSINTGKYAGTWNAWYIYTNEAWATKRTNIYIDAPWKE